MLLWHVPKKSSGFTLIEMLVAMAIVSILAAVAAPSLLGLLNRNRVNEAIREMEGALKEAQKQAIRTGKLCTIQINANGISRTGADDCLSSNRVLRNSVQLSTSRATIGFSGRGSIIINDADANLLTPVIVVSMPNNGTDKQACVVVQGALGVIRTGDYSGTIPTSPIPANCQSPN